MIAFLNELQRNPSSPTFPGLLSSLLPILGRDGITEELGISRRECMQHMRLFHPLCH